MATKIRTHLMFDGTAGDAMNFYVGLFPMSEVIDVSYYNEGENKGKRGSITPFLLLVVGNSSALTPR